MDYVTNSHRSCPKTGNAAEYDVFGNPATAQEMVLASSPTSAEYIKNYPTHRTVSRTKCAIQK
jgi:hypothetical protein